MADERGSKWRRQSGSIQRARGRARSRSPLTESSSRSTRRTRRPATTPGSCRLSGGGEARPIARIEVRRGSAKFSPGRPLGRVLVDRVGQAGDLRAAVPGLGPEDSDFERRRHRPGVAPHGRGAVLPRRQQDDGGLGRHERDRSCERRRPRCSSRASYYEGTGASCEMGGPSAANYDVTPDGQRFLMVRDNRRRLRDTRGRRRAQLGGGSESQGTRALAAGRARELRPFGSAGPADRSARSQALAIVHSRTTVAAEMPTTSAVSSIVSPPK